LIQELTSEESLELLARTRFGRLGCALGGESYVVPFYFAFNKDCLYSFSTVGRKIEWMRANPLVCVEADERAGELREIQMRWMVGPCGLEPQTSTASFSNQPLRRSSGT
jgi:nitroimidazol reductase NimA-like FMN-containing flavoprotein (pyridoxamine 5'-phosphate oxidase superfamily)